MPRRPKKSKASGIKSETKIDATVDLSHIKYKPEDGRTYYCSACGRAFKKREGNFLKSQSPLYAGNDGYVQICKNCTDRFYETLVDFFRGNEEKAMDRCCQVFDMYYNDDAVSVTKRTATRTRICLYPSKIALPQYGAGKKTYADTISDHAETIINSVEQIEEMKAEGQAGITKAMFERWGQVSPEDMTALEEHYRTLKKYNPSCDNNQEIFIKDLCYTKLRQIQAFRENNSTDFEKYTKLYRDTFKQAGLRTERDEVMEDTFGVTLATISQYTPEEYYKNKTLYKDFDGIGEYFSRFVLRPLKNLLLGTNERDEEYSVKDGGESGE